MREWIGRYIVVGTVVLIVGGLWTYASLQKAIGREKRVHFPVVKQPLPPPPASDDLRVSSVADFGE